MVNYKFPGNIVRDKNLSKEQISYKCDDEKSLLDEKGTVSVTRHLLYFWKPKIK